MSAPTSRPLVAVVPVLDSIASLPACIEALRRTAGPDLPIVAVDGGSTDGSWEWLQSRADVRSVRSPRPGVAAALNEGFRLAGDADVVRVHSDVLVETEDWVARLRAAADANPRAGVLGAKLLRPDGRIESIGRRIVSGLGMGDSHANLRAFETDRPQPTEPPVEVDSVHGAFAWIRREVLEETGGLDEGFAPMWFDDDDLCMAARHGGWKVFALPGIAAVHFTAVWSPTTQVVLTDRKALVPQIAKSRKTILAHHALRWQAKWGWQPYFPDLSEIRRLYGSTEIGWRIGERQRFRPTAWPPSVDAVVVTWNNRATLLRLMETLAATRYPGDRLHVHVVDNASTDGTVEALETLRPEFPFEISVHRLAVNTGVAAGMNWGIVKGDGELVARLDDDVRLPADWLEVLVENFRDRPWAGVVGPRILNDNATRDVQCGPYRIYPFIYGHDGEPDAGQATYRARCAHVRGCCNLYRRDVLADAGLFDIRFSPTQYDDPDHHVALCAAGYEVLYDGRVGVVHALSNGAARSNAAISNQAANERKLIGKWGIDVWRTLDVSLDLSREGRILPDDAKIGDYLERLPDPASFPKRDLPAASGPAAASIDLARRYRALAAKTSGPLMAFWDDTFGYSRTLRRDGRLADADRVLASIVDLAPLRTDALAELASVRAALGLRDRAAPLALRAARLRGETEAPAAAAVIPAPAAAAASAEPANRHHEIGEGAKRRVSAGSAPSMRVLFVNTFERRVPGGDMVQVQKTKQHLEERGVHVDLCYSARPDPRGYDLVHVFNLWFPHQTLPQVKGIRVAAPDVPIVLSPIYWDMSEKAWADGVVPAIFSTSTTAEELDRRLHDLAAGILVSNGRTRLQRLEPNFTGYEEYQREILSLVDHCLPQSEREMECMEATLGVRPPYTIVRNAAEPAVFDAATPDDFVREHGLRDFVLTVGLVEPRKNQLMLLHALRETGLPVVVVGRNYDPNYMRLCREAAGPRTLFLEHLPHERLASAMKAAAVFALPSWMECASFACVEAALAGCPLVVSDRTSEPEYFGLDAYACDPASVRSIRDAVLAAYQNRERDVRKRERLQRKFREECTWSAAAEATLAGYRAAMAVRAIRPWSAAETDESRLTAAAI